MKLHKLSALLLVLAMAFVLAACGGGDDNAGEDGVNLSQTINVGSADSGMLTVQYPEGWITQGVDDDHQVWFGNNEAALDTVQANGFPEGDDIGGTVVRLPDETMSVLIEGDDPSAADVLTAVIEDLLDDEDTTFVPGDVEEFTANDRNAAIVTGTGTRDNVTFNWLLAGTFSGDDFILVVMFVADGNIGQYEETARAMVGMATFEAPSG